MLCGIIGITVELFNEQGLIGQALNGLMGTAMLPSLSVLLLVLLALIPARRWYQHVFSRGHHIHILGNLLMRGMMLTGAYFIYLLVTTGSFRI